MGNVLVFLFFVTVGFICGLVMLIVGLRARKRAFDKEADAEASSGGSSDGKSSDESDVSTTGSDADDDSASVDGKSGKKGSGRGLVIGGVVLMLVSVVAFGFAWYGTVVMWTNSPTVAEITSADMIGSAKDSGYGDQNGWLSNSTGSTTSHDSTSSSNESSASGFDYDSSFGAGNTFSEVVESGFVKASESPVSTISADVDTASWSVLKGYIESGYKGPKDAARIEEMLNAFTYDYDVPSGTDDFAITRSVAPCPWNKDSYLLALGYASSAAVVDDKPLNVTFLVDVSGSMSSPDKLELVKKVVPSFVETLSGEDRVSLVTYSGNERLVLDGVSGDDKSAIIDAFNGLVASGSTNGSAGINMAYDVASRNFDESGINRVIMITDGDLNVGISSPEALKSFIKEKAGGGVYLNVIGVGSETLGDDRLEVLADNGDGVYSYMSDERAGHKLFCEDMYSNLRPFADDVKSQVSFNAGEVDSYRLIGYANRQLSTEDFKNDAVDAGEVGPGAQFTVLYEIVPTAEVGVADMSKVPEGVSFANGQLADLGLRWKSVDDAGTPHEIHKTLMVADVTDAPTDDWRFAAAVTEFGMVLGESEYRGTSSYSSIVDVLGFEPSVSTEYELGSREEFFSVVAKAHSVGIL